MKREAKIICPNTAKAPGNAPRALYLAQRDCVLAFGGYTAAQGDGGWIDDHGTLIAEPVTILTIACGPTPEQWQALDAIADTVGRMACQECVYIKYPNGNVELRDTAQLWNGEATVLTVNDLAAIDHATEDNLHRE